MGRPEMPVDHTVPALGALAEHLRAMRRAAGVTYEELAKHTNYSTALLKRAASGAKLPTRDVMRAYVRACALNMDDPLWVAEAATLWQEAASAVRVSTEEAQRSYVLPKPQYVRDEADLSGALRDAWAWAGRPSMRQLEARTSGQLPRSTAHAICRARTVPRDFRQFVAFLLACKITGTALRPWYGAWLKVFGMPRDKAFAAVVQVVSDGDSRRAILDLHRKAVDTPDAWRESVETEMGDFYAMFWQARVVACAGEGRQTCPPHA